MNVRYAILQLNLVAGSPARNMSQISRAVEGAKIASKGSSLLCFAPELAISGNFLESLPIQQGFLALCHNMLAELAQKIHGNVAVVLGCPEAYPNEMYPTDVHSEETYPTGLLSSIFLLADGKATRITSRPYSHAAAYGAARRIRANKTNMGVFTHCGTTFAVCSGLNQAVDAPIPESDILLCTDCEPFESGLWLEHQTLCKSVAQRARRPFIYVNPVGGTGSYIYAGGSASYNAEGKTSESISYWRQEILIDDISSLYQALPDTKDTTHNEAITAHPDVMDGIGNALILGIRDYVRKSGFTRAVLGLSGGMDSSIVAALATEALGANNVLGILMPSCWSSQGSIDDSAELAQNLGIKTYTVPITPLMNAFDTALNPIFTENTASASKNTHDTTKENLQARIRASVLMAFSNKYSAMLLSTSNKSESAVGYGTLYGDLAGSLMPIVDVYKTDVYRLAQWFNTSKGRQIIPQNVFDKPPSAELRPDQKDQDSLPPYDELDTCLRILFEGQTLCEQANTPAVDDETMRFVSELVRKNEFKRHQVPQGLYVSPCPLHLLSRPLPAVHASRAVS